MDDGGEFTFAAAAAGGGRMGVPPLLYPVFGRPRSPPRGRGGAPEPETATARVPLGRLLLVDRDAPADGGGGLGSVPAAAEMYCPWSPGCSASAPAAPARCKKSGSTGSVLRWRPRLVGRSQSDGKEKFVFLRTASAAGSSGRGKGRGGGDAVDSAWSYYAKGGGGGGGGGDGARRRSFLPYKQDLVGLFANAAVFRRSYHPF